MGGGPDKEHMVIVLWSPAPEARLAELKSRFPYIKITYLNLGGHENPTPKATNPEIPAEVYATATIWVTLGVLPATAETVPKLKWLHLFTAGVDHFHDHPLFTAPGDRITITTSSGVSAPPIAEWVLMTTLASTKHFTTTWEWQKERQWGGNGMHLARGRDWLGKTVGIAGYGSIGRQVARLFHAAGSRILAYTAHPRPTAASRADGGYIVAGTGDPLGEYPSAWYSGTSRAALHTFLQQGLDLLVICLPLTAATRHLVGAAEFAALAAGCATAGGPFVANVSRGTIVQQAALVAALNGGLLAGAMLDVVDPEPLPADDPLWAARNVVITPHVSALGVEYVDRAYDVLEGNLARMESGESLWNVVRRGRGY